MKSYRYLGSFFPETAFNSGHMQFFNDMTNLVKYTFTTKYIFMVYGTCTVMLLTQAKQWVAHEQISLKKFFS